MFTAKQVSDAYKAYTWEANHSLFGYPADQYPHFQWINSLEQRFKWLRKKITAGHGLSGIFLIREMIHWGGNQNGVLQKFEYGLGSICLSAKLNEVVSSLDNPGKAVTAACEIPGLGLTYGSKLLRFLDPDNYAALDSKICKGRFMSDIYINKSRPESIANGYSIFINRIEGVKKKLGNEQNPQFNFNVAQIEMAIFQMSVVESRN